ncbi:MAG TPA: tRNA lysidine(34) synthetase TilS [Solirubrobacter sp.]|nr:tRNA lysidine(34) synthetase TilS [Solirubrobacter sp.]
MSGVLVLFSGGRDSTCLLDLMVRGGGPVWALHVNYGLRGAESDADEAHCRAVCARLGVPLHVLRPGPPVGNVQAWARDVRYAEAERLAGERDALIATGHTASDQVETVLLRLATSPGRRALLGMPARSGRVIRPLLDMTRADTADHCRSHGLQWREDSSNATSARGLIRATILPALRDLHPAAEANILRTVAALREESTLLDALAGEAAAGGGDVAASGAAAAGGGAAAGGEAAAGGRAAGGGGAAGVDLAALDPALARLVLQRLADEAAGGQAPGVAQHAGAVRTLPRAGTAEHSLPGGLRVVSEYGRVRVEPVAAAPASPPAPSTLSVPGRTAFGAGELTAEPGEHPIADGTLAADALQPPLQVRAWRPGDRMRPLGLGGSKSLQDLFTDRKVPRERRHGLPVVLSGGEIAWVPGVATGERFRVEPHTRDRVRLTWRLHSAAP